jgi:hypothetical protein
MVHAELGATMPYRQAKAVTDLLLPTSGRDNHVAIRNHTVTIGNIDTARATGAPVVRDDKTEC